MEVIKGKAFVAKARCIKYENGQAFYSDPVKAEIDWVIEARNGKAYISFGFPMEYELNRFVSRINEDDTKTFCLNMGSVLGSEMIHLFSSECRRIRDLVKREDVAVAIAEGFSVQTASEEAEKRYTKLATRR